MKRILHILPQFQPGGGMDRVVMNYFSHVNHEEYVFDILCHQCEDPAYADQIVAAGGNVYVFEPFRLNNLKDHAVKFEALLNAQNYDVIHCHMANAAFLYLKIAKKHGIPMRIIHGHQDRYADTWSHSIRNVPLLEIGKRYATQNLACSDSAGKFLFRHRSYDVLKNAIDTNNFAFSGSIRQEWRSSHGFRERQIVFGNVGRLVPQKNQRFVLSIFAKLKYRLPNAALVIVGDGELKDELEEFAKTLGLSESVLWLDNSTDINSIYQGLDALIFPSLYEGLPMVLVEAQATGLPCFISNTISQESVATDLIKILNLHTDAQGWADEIYAQRHLLEKDRSRYADMVADSGFEIAQTTETLTRIYSGQALSNS
jgi:glycosyltransferase involved in cell wall biosynthesis